MTTLTDLLSSSNLVTGQVRPPHETKAVQTAKDFEAVFLTQFVDEMMKTTGATAFGSEKQAEMWRSFMSEAVAKHLVEQAGLGLSGNVEQMISAYTANVSSITESTP